jgi:hypothetical protein
VTNKELKARIREKKEKKFKKRKQIAVAVGVFLVLALSALSLLVLKRQSLVTDDTVLTATQVKTQPPVAATNGHNIYKEVYEDFLSPMARTFKVSTIEVDGKITYQFFRADTDEVTDDELIPLMKAADAALKLMETNPSFTTGDVNLNFQRPLEQGIVVLNRTSNAPAIVLELQELTMQPEDMQVEVDGVIRNEADRPLSIVNLAAGEPPVFDNESAKRFWSIIQAVCLGYARKSPMRDPACNIYSANAAAGLAHIDKLTAKQTIEDFGMTKIGSLSGTKDLKYYFYEDIYDLYFNNPYYQP